MDKKRHSLASIHKRIAGGLIDLLIANVITLVAIYFWANSSLATGDDYWQARAFIVGISVDAILTIFMMSGVNQGTIGQNFVGIKTIKNNGDPVDFGTAVGRYVVSIFSSLLFKIGYISAFFNSDKATLHDILAGTLVVDNKKQPENILEEVYPKRKTEPSNKSPIKIPVQKEEIDSTEEKQIWKTVYEEFESEEKDKALIAKLSVENFGDESKIRARYFEIRFVEIKNQKNIEIKNKKSASDEKKANVIAPSGVWGCLENGSYESYIFEGHQCYAFPNGQHGISYKGQIKVYKSKGLLEKAILNLNPYSKLSDEGSTITIYKKINQQDAD